MKICDQILEGYYTLSSHASDRMGPRGITLKDLFDCIKNGCIGGD